MIDSVGHRISSLLQLGNAGARREEGWLALLASTIAMVFGTLSLHIHGRIPANHNQMLLTRIRGPLQELSGDSKSRMRHFIRHRGLRLWASRAPAHRAPQPIGRSRPCARS